MVVLKPNLQDKEKKVLMIVIPLQVVANIAQVANKFGIKFFLFFIYFYSWATNWAQSLNGARGSQLGQVRALKKTRYPKRAESGPWVLPRGLSSDMKKPDPLPFLLAMIGKYQNVGINVGVMEDLGGYSQNLNKVEDKLTFQISRMNPTEVKFEVG